MEYRNKLAKPQEDDDVPLGGIQLFNKPVVINSVDVYLDGPIGEVAYYRELLNYMRSMEEGDELRIWIDTEGGLVDTAMAIIDAMENTDGDVVCIVNGKAFSAGSLIALRAPNLLIGNNATFMIHSGSFGTGRGKQGDVVEFVKFNKKYMENIMRDSYKFFLTDAEIDEMLMGKDFWFDTQETKERLENRLKLQEEFKKKAQELAEVQIKPKARKAKVKPAGNTNLS